MDPHQVPLVAPPVALYVHVPFCVSLCPYCDFVVYAGAAARGPGARVEAFASALLTELDLRADRLDADFPGHPPLETVYIGGGTPTLLPTATIAAHPGAGQRAARDREGRRGHDRVQPRSR